MGHPPPPRAHDGEAWASIAPPTPPSNVPSTSTAPPTSAPATIPMLAFPL